MRIVSAGMYRSGSTWLFNAIRLLCGDCYSCFRHKGSDYDEENDKEIHLIKTHRHSNYLSNHADFVITIYRDIREVKESMKRRALVATKGFINESRVELFDTYHHNAMLWIIESDLIVNYQTMIENPVFVLKQIELVLFEAQQYKPHSESQLENIADELRNLKVPNQGHDPVTLLHAEHITKKTW